MKFPDNMVGARFGKLTVLSVNRSKTGWISKETYNCKCDCGRTDVISRGALYQGTTACHKCMRREASDRLIIDLTGQRFGKLTVIGKACIKNNRVIWHCKCDCGNELDVVGDYLRQGHRRQCYECEKGPPKPIHVPREPYKDLVVGFRTGKLEIVDIPNGKITNGEDIVKCHCDCGRDVFLKARRLSGDWRPASCGCARYRYPIDLTGKDIGAFHVIEPSTCTGTQRDFRSWNCICKYCGKHIVLSRLQLLSARDSLKSCGCLAKSGKPHMYRSDENALRTIFHGMMARCYYKGSRGYPKWGGRGITICDEWRTDIDKFIEWSLNNGYSQGLSLDRIDNDGPYSPENCRWATNKEQANNTRRNVYLMEYGTAEFYTVSQWADALNISDRSLAKFVRNHGREMGEQLVNELLSVDPIMMDDIKRVRRRLVVANKLEEKIRHANLCYWVLNSPCMEDNEYDKLVKALRELDPTNPVLNEIGKLGVDFSRDDAVVHRERMYSLDKVYSWSELIEWAKKVARSQDEVFLCQPKFDGISIAVQGDRLITRGDGIKGHDVTYLAPHIGHTTRYELLSNDVSKYRPDTIGMSPILAHSEDSDLYTGELMIKVHKFESLRDKYEQLEEYKTPRNMVAGFANSKPDSDTFNLVDDHGRPIYFADFVSHEAISIKQTLRELIEHRRDVVGELWEFDDCPTDGMVVKLADREYAKSLGFTSHHPRGAIALKMSQKQVWVTVNRIEWQTGETRISPVCIFDAVKLDGVMVSRASLHCRDYVETRKVGVGSKVLIERRGGVIPKVVDVRDNGARVVIPDKCPACESPLQNKGAYLVCTSPDCIGGNVARIYRGLNVFGIKYIGPSLITKAVKEFYIRDIIDWATTFGSRDPSTIDILKKKGFTTNEIKVLTGISVVMSDGSTPANILASVCIPKCSTEFVNTIETDCGGISRLMTICPVDRMYDEIVGKCKIDAVTNFMQWIEENYERFMTYFDMFHLLEPVTTESNGQTVCFTGAGPMSRKDLQSLAISHGYQCTENANQCNVLVAADPNGNSSKLQKARAKGIKVIGYEEFLNLVSA